MHTGIISLLTMVSVPKKLAFEAFMIDHLVDAKGRYQLELNPTFPMSIKPFLFPVETGYGLNWHERLEIFVAVEGEGDFRMGDKIVAFRPGDVLLVENMKLHGLAEFRGKRRRAISISFLPEFVYNLGSPLCDFTFLVPFYSHSTTEPQIIRTSDPGAHTIHSSINRLLRCYFSDDGAAPDQPGCRLYLLELLYWLAQHFREVEPEHSEYLRQQRRTRRLAKLLEYIQANYAEHISVEDGAEITAMSVSRFMRFFKETAGMTFVAYLTHVRLTAAANLLRNLEMSIGDVAAAAGFADQSYFGRVFRKQFGMTPKEFRIPNGSLGHRTD
jgi:AraC-like DNA-binding protein